MTAGNTGICASNGDAVGNTLDAAGTADMLLKPKTTSIIGFVDNICQKDDERLLAEHGITRLMIKDQLQRFYKLISDDRIWPSEHDFEVIFEKSLFVFEISAFKVRNKRGIHSRFHSFSENINRETFVGDVTSDQSSMISTQRSDLT